MESKAVPERAVKAAAISAVALAGAALIDRQYAITADIRQLLADKRFRSRVQKRAQQLGRDTTIYHMLQLCDPNGIGLWFENRSWSWRDIKTEVDRIAGFLQDHGVSQGDFVAVFMGNSPEMVFTVYALAALGAVPALINATLRNQTLSHCLRISKAKVLLCTPELAKDVHEASSEVPNLTTSVSLDLTPYPPGVALPTPQDVPGILTVKAKDLVKQKLFSGPSPDRSLKDIGALIYTSGTSGKPKAVSIKNFLLMVVSTPTSPDIDRRNDYFPLRIYSCMPLFHATCLFTGLYYATGASSQGLPGTFCLSRKFSASNFARQLYESGATRMLYVGELCRFMLAAPPSAWDRLHQCVVATGNGLQKDVWDKFKKRYNIPEIREIYRSTEGVAKFDNVQRGMNASGTGMVGHSGPLGRWFEDETYLVRFDPATEEPWRNEKGFCVLAKAGEPGEAIGRVRTMDFYNEYLDNPQANDLKLIRNVFAEGDLFQRTGDLLLRDSNGWVRFYDRSGDTYRWRGENVSAGEVREHIGHLPNVADVSVYGMKLEGYDGQAGAAAIILEDNSTTAQVEFCAQLHPNLRKRGLATWQLPRLVRLTSSVERNATFKQAKEVLKQRSWVPTENQDSLWWLDGEVYSRLDPESWASIAAGKAKL